MLAYKETKYLVNERETNYDDSLGAGGFRGILLEKYNLLIRVAIRDQSGFPIVIDELIEMYLEDVERLVFNYHRIFEKTYDDQDMNSAIRDDMFVFECEALAFAERTLKRNNLAYRKAIYGSQDFFLKEIRETYSPQFRLLSFD